MRIKYFQTAWNDISNSEGWFGKLCLLALVGCIPIFGQIVVLGYLYGWAREIAWGVHEPLPAKVFGNEDGKLYRRGFFILIIVVVYALVPSIVTSIGDGMQSVSYYALAGGGSVNRTHMAVGGVLNLIGLALMLFASILAWIASMRVAIYNRLSAGFQLGTIWKMLRHDTNGIMRIFGMNIVVGLILGIVLTILYTVLMMLVVFAGFAGLASAGYSFSSLGYLSDAEALRFLLRFVASAGFVGVVCLIVAVFVSSLVMTFAELLVARVLGYWTLQFEVPRWGGQNDPLPFEHMQAPVQTPPVVQAPPAVAPTVVPVAMPQVQSDDDAQTHPAQPEDPEV